MKLLNTHNYLGKCLEASWSCSAVSTCRIVQNICGVCVQSKTGCTFVETKGWPRWRKGNKKYWVFTSHWQNYYIVWRFVLLTIISFLFFKNLCVKLVIWDYHVILVYKSDDRRCLVFDLDSDLPFPTFFHKVSNRMAKQLSRVSTNLMIVIFCNLITFINF